MGLGNGNSKNGNKGSNHDYELRILQLLNEVRQAAASGGAPIMNQPCGLDDLSNVNTTYGAGKRAFSINLTAGSAIIGGIALNAPTQVSFSESGTGNTLAGVTIVTTGGDTECLGTYVG